MTRYFELSFYLLAILFPLLVWSQYTGQNSGGETTVGPWGPFACSTNETSVNCAPCDKKCGQNGTTECPEVCAIEGNLCRCHPNYVRNESNQCILEADCPADCGGRPNEQWKDCASHCEPNCVNQKPVCILSCAPPACQCTTGFVRYKGQCIPPGHCPKCEKSGEVLTECPVPAGDCEGSCSNPNPNPCPTLRCGDPECRCKKGLLRFVNRGPCVGPTQCCREKPNEEWKTCATRCEPTCQNPNPICVKICDPPKCQCKKDFVRCHGKCIPKTSCPKNE